LAERHTTAVDAEIGAAGAVARDRKRILFRD